MPDSGAQDPDRRPGRGSGAGQPQGRDPAGSPGEEHPPGQGAAGGPAEPGDRVRDPTPAIDPLDAEFLAARYCP